MIAHWINTTKHAHADNHFILTGRFRLAHASHHAPGGGAKHAHNEHTTGRRSSLVIAPARSAAGDGTDAVSNQVSIHISSHMTVVAFIIWPCVPSDSRGKEDPNATEEGGKEEEGEKGEEGEAKEEEEEEGEARRW